jgi:hypothetical protein
MFEMPWTILLLRRLRFLAQLSSGRRWTHVFGSVHEQPILNVVAHDIRVAAVGVPIFVWKLPVASQKTVLPSAEGVRRWYSNLICVIPCMTTPSQSEVTGPNLSCRWARFAFVSLRPVVLDRGV